MREIVNHLHTTSSVIEHPPCELQSLPPSHSPPQINKMNQKKYKTLPPWEAPVFGGVALLVLLVFRLVSAFAPFRFSLTNAHLNKSWSPPQRRVLTSFQEIMWQQPRAATSDDVIEDTSRNLLLHVCFGLNLSETNTIFSFQIVYKTWNQIAEAEVKTQIKCSIIWFQFNKKLRNNASIQRWNSYGRERESGLDWTQSSRD